MRSSEDKLEGKLECVILELSNVKLISSTGSLNDTQLVYGKNNEYVIPFSNFIEFHNSILANFILKKIYKDYYGRKSIHGIHIFNKKDPNGLINIANDEYQELKKHVKEIEKCKT